ncbi:MULTISPECIES: endonuclease domain-containing protein [unclassified Devosia]|uniref:endonuclease domain-containing protein n=1 Tax=unclassified Devosia TaxID=196773 RepID=UPI0025B8156E|nr:MULTISPECIES: endonuclease domain-containing protein [unclassified Devosia]
MRASSKSYSSAKRMRREMPLPEVIHWQLLRGGKVDGLRFRRQHPIGPFVLDFYCAERKLAIEVDGLAHDNAERFEQDERRTMWLNNQGIQVIRFMASDILDPQALEAVVVTIRENVAPSTSYVGPPPPPRGGGSGGVP